MILKIYSGLLWYFACHASILPEMQLKLKENYMSLTGYLGLTSEIQITNASNKILYVTLNDSQYTTGAVDPRCRARFQLTHNVARITISYYGDDREMTTLCNKLLLNRGRSLLVSTGQDDPCPS